MDKGKLVVFRGCGRGKQRKIVEGYAFLFGGDKNILQLIVTIIYHLAFIIL